MFWGFFLWNTCTISTNFKNDFDAQNAGNRISRLQISKIFRGRMPPDPPTGRGLRPRLWPSATMLRSDFMAGYAPDSFHGNWLHEHWKYCLINNKYFRSNSSYKVILYKLWIKFKLPMCMKKYRTFCLIMCFFPVNHDISYIADNMQDTLFVLNLYGRSLNSFQSTNSHNNKNSWQKQHHS